MENNCLVTRLKAVVNNSNLRKLGEAAFKTFRSDNATATTNCITFVLSGECTSLFVRVISGDGFLSDSDLTSNRVKEKTYQKLSNGSVRIYFTNADAVIGVSDISGITGVGISGQASNWEFNFDEFAGYTGQFTYINLTGAHVTGNIKNFNILSTTFEAFVTGTDQLNRSLGNSLYGDITSLNGFFDSRNIRTIQGFGYQPNIVGDIASFANANPNITFFQTFKGTGVTGDLSMIAPAAKACFFSGTDKPDGGKFKYSGTRDGGYFIFVENGDFGSDLERYIVDQANKELYTGAAYNKIISVYGTIDLTKAEVTTAIAAIKDLNPTVFTINGQNMLA